MDPETNLLFSSILKFLFACFVFMKPSLGKPSYKKNGKKSGQCPYGGEGGLPQFINFSLILPGPQITWKWTIHTDKLTTKCHICLHTWKQGGLMCGIWDWQSTIVKDLNDSQDPKHTLICRENAFVAIYALFSDNKCPLFTRLGGGAAQSGHCHSYMMASLSVNVYISKANWVLGSMLNLGVSQPN